MGRSADRPGRRFLHVVVFSAVLFLAESPIVPGAFCEEGRAPDQISVVFENDAFFGGDSDYTNGVALFWIPAGTPAPRWITGIARWLPWFPEEGMGRHGYVLGQNMYTPRDLELVDPPLADRPYAGWLYATAGVGVETGRQLDVFAVTAGVLGPASFGEQSQKFIHGIIGSTRPKGWDTQLRNEPGIYLTSQRTWRAITSKTLVGLDFDVAPHLGGTLGNVYTYANAGFTMRYGKDLPLDFGPPRVQPTVLGGVIFEPTAKLMGYLFASVEGRAVARNIFLDGNTFKDSRSVDKEPFVGDLQWGLVLTWRNFRVSFTDVFRTREFETQEESEHYGSICLSMSL